MRLSLRYKFIIGFLMIFYIGYTIMSFYIHSAIVETNNSIIKKDLLSFEKDLRVYVKEYFESESLRMDPANFNSNAGHIAEKVSAKIEARVIVYSYSGDVLSDSANADGIILNYEDMDHNNQHFQDEDLKAAIHHKSAFMIVPVKDKYLVVYAYPVTSNGTAVGILRCILNYSEVFSASKNLLMVINTLILVVFGAIFLFVVLLANKIAVPIVKLSKISKDIAKGNFDVHIEVNSKDEIGELAQNFSKMNGQIKQQIEVIKWDRDNLKKIEGYRKAFFDNMTHEMKTPLTIISGYCQILMDQNFEDRQLLQKSIKKIKNESEHMHKMVLQLLEASKEESCIDEWDREEVNVSQVVDSACTDMKIKADKYDILMEREIENEVFVMGNSQEIRRAIINVIDNSIKYGDVKSTIRIRVFKENSHCHIVIEDKGRGIPQNKLDMIFQPFYRIGKQNASEDGSHGLGLHIVKGIIDKHNGEITVISQEKIGTKVCIKIPLKVYKTATSV